MSVRWSPIVLANFRAAQSGSSVERAAAAAELGAAVVKTVRARRAKKKRARARVR
jgi:hypothetical protein